MFFPWVGRAEAASTPQMDRAQARDASWHEGSLQGHKLGTSAVYRLFRSVLKVLGKQPQRRTA